MLRPRKKNNPGFSRVNDSKLGARNELKGTDLADPGLIQKRVLEISNAGVEAFHSGDLATADASFVRALEFDPHNPGLLNLLGLTRYFKGDRKSSAQLLERACALDPASFEYHRDLGYTYRDLGQIEKAIDYWRKALNLQRDAELYTEMLLHSNYVSILGKDYVYTLHRQFDESYCTNLELRDGHLNSRDPNKRLRVGYVSVDFRRHLGAPFLRDVLGKFNPEEFDVYVYHVDFKGRILEDDFTAYLGTLPVTWRRFSGDDKTFVEVIRADGIDILVDLCGHTGGNRLLAFARKPAPIQVTWLGYPNTTGLSSMDYRVVDSVSDPEGIADGFSSEKLVRMEGGFLGFSPPELAPEICSPPYFQNGFVTFGSFNNPAKISKDVLKSWSEIVRQVPRSRLFLKGRLFDSSEVKLEWQNQLESFGVPIDRQVLMGFTKGHLEYYNEIDISLDTFPYNGTITTFDALWMGVPVVSELGDSHASRVGASILIHSGLESLVASNRDAYVAIAVALAMDPERLKELRFGMRNRVQHSTLCAPGRFIRYLEAAYRGMWARWCSGLPPEALWIRAVAQGG